MELRQKVYGYFLGRVSELPARWQFHFFSRLWLWNRDPVARVWLDQYRENFFSALNRGDFYPPASGSRFREARGRAWEYFSELRSWNHTLFPYLFAETVYGMPVRQQLWQKLDRDQLRTAAARLLHQPRIAALLSSQAANFFSLANFFGLPAVTPMFYLTVAREHYQLDEGAELYLQQYWLIHSVLGASFFYARAIPERQLDVFAEVMALIEDQFRGHFSELSLDIKFEYLVCCRMLQRESPLASDIIREAEGSLSAEGDFLVDVHNLHQGQSAGFQLSEHRNVLFLMATSPRAYTSYASPHVS